MTIITPQRPHSPHPAERLPSTFPENRLSDSSQNRPPSRTSVVNVVYVASRAKQPDVAWYEEPDIQRAVLVQLAGREVWVNAENYASPRPRVVRSPVELLSLIPRNRASSVYGSVESFRDPALLGAERLETLRSGWDFVLDIDSSQGIEEAKHCTEAILRLLVSYDIRSARVKFSGRRGFHIMIDGEAFDCFRTKAEFIQAYPTVPLQVARFIIAALKPSDRKGVEIDTAIYTPRRLIRVAYSLHHKTGLVSLPIEPSAISQFDPENVKPVENMDIDWKWLEAKAKPMEASTLLNHVAKWLQRTKPRLGVKILSHSPTRAPHRAARNPPCIEALLKEGFSKRLIGHRNAVLFAVLSGIRRLNFTITPTQLEELNARSEMPLPERELQYQIKYQLSRLRPYLFRCELMQDAGLCPPQRCPIVNFVKGAPSPPALSDDQDLRRSAIVAFV